MAEDAPSWALAMICNGDAGLASGGALAPVLRFSPHQELRQVSDTRLRINWVIQQ